MAGSKNRKALAFALVLAGAFLLIFLSGCATSSKYVPCCSRSTIYNASNNPQTPLSSPNCTLESGDFYGFCDGASLGNGTIWCLPSQAAQCNKPLAQCSQTIGCVWDGSAAPNGACRVLECSDLTSNQSCTSAGCTWGASCTGSQAYVQMSVCVDANPSSCTNNKCSVMLCGYKKLVPAPPPVSSDWNNGSTQPAAVSQQQDPVNLLGTSCTFKTMNDATYNSVKNSKGALWANAFRFGVGASFADFEASRFFFPLSDRFCAGITAPGARDRFVVYLNAGNTWCAPQTSGVITCTENWQNFTDMDTCTGYCRNPAHCVASSSTGFKCIETGLVYSNQTLCKQECGIVENPNSCSLSQAQYPFLESDSRYKMATDGSWELNYSYYQTRLESQYTNNGNQLKDYECETGTDCMSGYCDYTTHIRGLCVNISDDTKRIDCGCRSQQVDGSTILNCSNALSGYTIYRSTIDPAFNGKSQGPYEYVDNAWLYNPYFDTGMYNGSHDTTRSGKFNTVEQITDGVLFSQGSGGNLGNIGSTENQTFRFYVLDNGTNSPPKIFADCGISRTSKQALYTASASSTQYSSPITTGSFWGPGANAVPAPASDGYGPGSAPFCLYSMDKVDPDHGCCSGATSHWYSSSLIPPYSTGACPSLYIESSPFNPHPPPTYPGTGVQHCFSCTACSDRCYFIYGSPTNPPQTTSSLQKYWVYELSFDGNSDRLGQCKLVGSTMVPYVDARNIGWCEGCTYSTLASQTVNGSDYSQDTDWIADNINNRMPLYLQANIMPVIDIRNTTLTSSHTYTSYCEGGYYDWNPEEYGQQYECFGYGYNFDDETDFDGLAICKNNSGAALYIVSDLTKAGDFSTPTSNSPDTANAVGDPIVKSESQFVPYLENNAVLSSASNPATYDPLDPTCNSLYLNGYASTLWRSQILKDGCPNQPLTAIFLNGYSNRAITSDPAQLSALIGSQSSPGLLYRFFYNKTILGLYPSESPLSVRVQTSTPDHYPNNVDMLAQEWYPMCDAGDNTTTTEFEARMNFSRALLSNFSKPSIITKFHFPAGSQCNQDEFLQYMFRHKGDMVDAGIMGLIYDNWNNTAVSGYLDNPLDASTGKVGTPFCPVQNYSKMVMGLTTLTYGQQIVADNQSCVCQPCDQGAIASGTCDKQLVPQDSLPQSAIPYQMCNDGQYCQMPNASYTNYSKYFCAPMCVNISACKLCSSEVGANISCRIDTLYQSYKTIKNFTELNDMYWDLIAALPAQDKCCLQTPVENDTLTYTYMQKQSVTQRSEMLQFPRVGDVGIDCGRTPDTSFLTYCGIDVPINQEAITCFKVG